MSEIQDVSDGQAAQPAETEVGQAITPVTYTGSAVVLDPIERVLVDLETKHKNVVFDLTTTKGDKAARQARKELVQVRTGAAAAYKAWNAPLLEEQRKARDRVKEIEQRVTVLEEPIDAQIKADEARREAERIERERLEAERVAKIRERITNISNVPVLAVEMGSDEIRAVMEDINAMPLTEERFGEFLSEAEDTAARVHEKLESMLAAAVQREEAAETLRKQQEELDRQRRELAAAQEELARKQREQEEAARRDQILREEAARQAADKAARDAEDARRAQAGQADAFPAEKAEAREVVQAEVAERRAAAAPVSAPAQPPAAAPSPMVNHDVVELANAAASEATAVERDEVVGAEVPPFFDAPAESNWAPSAADIVDMVADVQGVDAVQALAWLQAIDFKSVTIETLRHGQ